MKKFLFFTACMFLSLVMVNAEVCTEDCVASIGETKYYSIMDAINDVAENNEEMVTIKVLRDSSNESGIILTSAEAKKITIDFDGHKVVITQPVGNTGTKTQALHFEKGNEVVLKNGTIEIPNSSSIKMGIQNYTKLTLEDLTVDASSTSIAYTISNNAGELSITGSSSVLAPEGKVAFDLYWWPTGSYANGPKVVVNTTGTITGNIELSKDSSNSGVTPSSLVINNVNFTGTINKTDEKSTVLINGGTFSNDVDESYIRADYRSVNIGGKYYVKPSVCTEDCVASIGETKYYSIMEAINDVVENNEEMVTIKVLKDSSNESGIILTSAEAKKITIDFDGHKVVITQPVGNTGTKTQALHFEKGNEVVLKNGTIEIPNSSSIKMGIQNYTKLTLEDLTVDASSTSIAYTISNNAGELSITGSSSVLAPEGKVAFDLYWWPTGSYANGPKVVVNTTGTITGNIELSKDSSNSGVTPSSLVINNVNFTGTINKTDEKSTVLINGGTYDVEPSVEYLAENYVTNESNSKYIVVENKKLDTNAGGKTIEFENKDSMDHDYRLEVNEKTKEETNSLSNELTKKFQSTSNTKILALYDINVKDENDTVIKMSDGNYRISVELDESLQIYDVYKAIYVNDSNEIEETIDAKLVDNKIVFDATHLSTYGIVGYNNVVENPQTLDTITTSIIICILSIISTLSVSLYLRHNN